MNDATNPLSVVSAYPAQRWDAQGYRTASERVAEEVPISLVYNGMPYVVMMAMPQDLEDFGLGFSLSEGILKSADELHAIEVLPASEGVELHMDIQLERFLPLEAQRRNLAGRSSCGLCGTETIEQAVRHPPRVGAGVRTTPAALQRAFAELAERQSLNAMTGGVHEAGWATPQGEVLFVREDVGRHNALDKLIGAVVRAGHAPRDGMALITSRASFEMAQKAATVGITLLAAISAPTGLAIRLAEETDLTLIAFARNGQHNVYANAQRVTG
jgi:formate dehydrogenase accessory protein FdhD